MRVFIICFIVVIIVFALFAVRISLKGGAYPPTNGEGWSLAQLAEPKGDDETLEYSDLEEYLDEHPIPHRAAHVSDAYFDAYYLYQKFDKKIDVYSAEEVNSMTNSSANNQIWTIFEAANDSRTFIRGAGPVKEKRTKIPMLRLLKNNNTASAFRARRTNDNKNMLRSSQSRSQYHSSQQLRSQQPVQNSEPRSSQLDSPSQLLHGKCICPYIYIEFMYQSMSVPFIDFYEGIHDATLKIFERLKKLEFNVAIIRLKRKNVGQGMNLSITWPIDLQVKQIDDDFTVVVNKDERINNSTLHIPDTTGGLLMDEAIYFKCEDEELKRKYKDKKCENKDEEFKLVQIEHSEGLSSHKSNALEFILRYAKFEGLDDYKTYLLIRAALTNYEPIIINAVQTKDEPIIIDFKNGLSLENYSENCVFRLLPQHLKTIFDDYDICYKPSLDASIYNNEDLIIGRNPADMLLSKNDLVISSKAKFELILNEYNKLDLIKYVSEAEVEVDESYEESSIYDEAEIMDS